MHRVLERQYPAGDIFTTDFARPSESIEQFAAMPEAFRHRIRLVKGHMPFGVHRFTRPPTAYCTMLRDPIERVISLYYYVLSQPTHHLHRPVIESQMSLEDFVLIDASGELTNAMTMKFVLDPFSDEPVPRSPQASLERAQRVLEKHFAVVGLVERYDETLLMMRHHFGWSFPYYAKQNVNRDRPAQAEALSRTLEIIRERNALDLALYEFAASRFQCQMDALGPVFTRQLRLFRIENWAWRRFDAIFRFARRVWNQKDVHL